MKAKILLQNVWAMSNKEKKYGWDDELPIEYVDEWMKIKTRAIALNSIAVRRWIHTAKNNDVQIYGYCDASQRAYAACVYIRTVENNAITSTLLAAKSKNAPSQTIPKLELCGAKLLTQLVKKVCKCINVNITQIHLWCDSKCVLGWIAANPQRYEKFVSSRIVYIQKLKNVKWHHIAGKDNPADCASRGVFGDELKDHKLWWHGAPNLVECIEFNQDLNIEYTTENELIKNKVSALISTKIQSFIPQASSFYKLKKIMAFVLRFIHNCKRNETKRVDHISVREMRQATTTIIKIMQKEEFNDEIICLKNEKIINKISKLIKLNVFFDCNDMLRVGGRLKNANMTFDSKHQLVIPKNHTVTSLIIVEAHKSALHGGPKLVESIIRRKFWIIDSQSTIKKK